MGAQCYGAIRRDHMVAFFVRVGLRIIEGFWEVEVTMRKRENRKVTRLILEEPLKVVLCSIGAQVRYELATQNISYTGFFLKFDKPGRFPFTPASIMEVWLELTDEKTIFFNGKMARVVHKNDPSVEETGTGIAIKIVQIEAEEERFLREFIESHIVIHQQVS